jgi:hypothetical protein
MITTKKKQPMNDFDFLDTDSTSSESEGPTQTSNPFFLAMGGSAHQYVKTKLLASESNSYFFIMCLATNTTNLSGKEKNLIGLFYDPESDLNELYGQSHLVTIVKAPFFLVNIPSIRAGLVKVKSLHLQKFNSDESELLSEEAFVYLMLESTKSDVDTWLRNYQHQDTLDKFIRQKTFMIYNGLNDGASEKMLIKYISNVGDFAYWENETNCNLSINKAFHNRKINLRIKWKLPVDEIERIGKEFGLIDLGTESGSKATAKDTTNTTNTTNTRIRGDRDANRPYPSGLNIAEEKKTDPLKYNIYVDASKPDRIAYFQVSTPADQFISQQTVQELLLSHALNSKEKYYLICNLLISKNYAHYVLSNPDILELSKPIFQKFSPIFRYVWSYAFLTLYKEESILKTRTTKNSRHVFTIEAASKFPVFPFVTNSPHLNPYFPLLLEKKALNSETNINSIKSRFRYQAGIVDLAEFKRRLNIFMSGKANCNLLDGANWSNMAITGGSMAAIMPRINPLMALFKSDFHVMTGQTVLTESELNRYFSEYYDASDVDVACNHANFFDFIEHVKALKQVIESNGQIKGTNIQINPIKTVCIYVDTDILRTKCQAGDLPFSFDYAVKNKNCPEVKHFFYEIYLKEKIKSNTYNKLILKDRINDPLYYIIIDYAHLDDISIVFRDHLDKVGFGRRTEEAQVGQNKSEIKFMHALNKSMEDVSDAILEATSPDDFPPDVFIKTMDTVKYKIVSKNLKHSFEVFRIDYPDFFSTISRFHFPCVRSYYDGTTCYLATSAIMSYMTMCNIEYKFFSGSSDPVSIVQKYRQRGYTAYFNRNEINQFIGYTLTNDTYRALYGIAPDAKTADGTSLIGALDHSNIFFKPQKTIRGATDYLLADTTYETETKDIIDYYTEFYPNCCSSIFTQTAIDEKGNVNPVKRWMIDMVYDLLK